ncbi:MAG: 30S ribosomal protein S20 [Candidatus Paceibacterota bacterium]
MPKIKSAKKALRQSARRKKQNIKRRDNLKKALKNFQGLVKAGKLEEAKKYLSEVYKIADKTAKANTIKKGKADRMKSRLSQLLARAKSSKTSS